MGASESSARSNGTKDKKEEEANNESSVAAATFAAAAADVAKAAAEVASATLIISKTLSDKKDEGNRHVNVMPPRLVWLPPPQGRFKMNTNGRSRPTFVGNLFSPDGFVQRGPSGYGGILRDHHGRWVRGFIGFIGEADCLTSELHGILKGLELLVKLNLKGAILETYCKAAYEVVTRHGDFLGLNLDLPSNKNVCLPSGLASHWHSYRSIMQKCKQLDIVMTLIHGEANRCADKLADMAIETKKAYVEIQDRPYQLTYLVEREAGVNG